MALHFAPASAALLFGFDDCFYCLAFDDENFIAFCHSIEL